MTRRSQARRSRPTVTVVTDSERLEARVARAAMLLAAVLIVGALLWIPEFGLDLVWNLLIPVAPLVLVVVPGIWRNVCPLATVAEQGGRLAEGLWERPRAVREPLVLGGLVLLAILVPMRHIALDTSGVATVVALTLLGGLAFTMGALFLGKSGWCGSLCPVYAVERTYGKTPLCAIPNTRCDSCSECCSPCPETGLLTGDSEAEADVQHVMAGAFPGFVWGWFQVPDYTGIAGWVHAPEVYLWCLAPALVSYAVFRLMLAILPPERCDCVERFFAFLAVSCYYYFRLPALFGFSPFPGDGVLVDLSESVPEIFPFLLRCGSTVFFALWILARHRKTRVWSRRVERDRVALPVAV